ncbi:PilN domain-containing protein [Actinoplanes sp. NPDC049265]|uniref:PilN domain-containing protein n=1 Tax=Actinoplanes sp. NPDC049265 TaxID=3363902 RepID=UPI0037176A7F
MAQTTLMPLDPALSPQQVTRVLSITADLLPEEVVAARRARRTRGWVLAVVGMVVLALAGWYVVADRGTGDAAADLESVTAEQSRLQRKQTGYGEVVNTQSENIAITKQLKTLMANDMQWAVLIDTLRDTGQASKATVTGISATLVTDKTGAPAPALPSTSGAATVGTITITGTAPDKPSVARYAETLNQVSTLANPYVTSVTQEKEKGKGVTFGLTVDVTTRALCGRFTTPCKTTGGN